MKQKTTIYIEPETMTQIRQLAAENEVTYSQQFAKIVEEYVGSHAPDPEVAPASMRHTSEDKVRIWSYVTEDIASAIQSYATVNKLSISGSIASLIQKQLKIENTTEN